MATRVVVALLLALAPWSPAAAQTPGASPTPRPTGVPLEAEAMDARDAVGSVAEAAHVNLVAAPGLKGPLTLDLKALEPPEALRVLAAGRGHVLAACGAVRVLVPRARASVPELPALSLTATRPYNLSTEHAYDRACDVRQLLLNLGRAAHVTILVGASVEGQVLARLREAPIGDSLRAVAWACGLGWAQLGPTLFVGSPAEVAEASACYERSTAP